MKTILTKSVKKTASFIKRSEVAAFPTETVYGLGANVFDEEAVEKIFKVKKRPADNPLIVHISDKKQIELLAEKVPDTAKKIIARFFPGPITIILKKNEIVPDAATAGLDSIAIRMPASSIARKFIKECGVPIAAPSANLAGMTSPTTYRHVLEDFGGKIPCILTGPEAKYGMESTVVDCTSKVPAVLRPGVITIEQLRKIDRRIKLKAVIRAGKAEGKVKSPGQKYRHYAPKARVVIVSNRIPAPALNMELIPFLPQVSLTDTMTPLPQIAFAPMPKKEMKTAYIGITALKDENVRTIVLICRSVEDYAKKLYSFFRECDRKKVDIIYAQKVPETGIGLAVMNRLKKASVK